jgi:hypothetical protein
MSDDSDDEQRVARQRLSCTFSKSGRSLIRKVQAYALRSRRASALLVLSTGSVTAARADIEQCGAAFRELGPEGRAKLDYFLRLLLDGDARGIRALSSLDDPAVSELPAEGFFEHAQKEGLLAPCQVPMLKGALVEYRRQQQGTRKHVGKENKPPTGRQPRAMHEGRATIMQKEGAAAMQEGGVAAMQEGGAAAIQEETATLMEVGGAADMQEGGAPAMLGEGAFVMHEEVEVEGLLSKYDKTLDLLGFDINQPKPNVRRRPRTQQEKFGG